TINGVGEVTIVGGQARQINVLLDPYRLRAYNLTALDVRHPLQTQNLQVPGGALDEAARRLSVRTQGRVQNMGDLGNIVVKTQQGQPIRIRDVATVEDAGKEAESIANVNGQTAVLLQVRKQSGANSIAVIDAVKEKLKTIAPTLPPGYETRI